MPTPRNLPISRWSDPESLVVGARAIVRRRLTEVGPDGTHLTDVIGVVESLDDPVVLRKKDGESVSVPRELIQVIKPLPATVVRNSDIRAVEYATAEAFPGVHHTWVNGWLVRVSDGVTERSNSAVPLEPQTAFDLVPIEQIREIYRSHGLPTLIEAPDRIARPAWQLDGRWERGPEIVVMTRELSGDESFITSVSDGVAGQLVLPPDSSAAQRFGELHWEVNDQPDDDWLAMYHFRGKPLPESSLRQLCTEINGHMGFGQIKAGGVNGKTVAITRGTITSSPDGRSWLGYSAVEVDAACRRQGLGTMLGKVMLDWGARMGAGNAYLQVIESNAAGRGLYQQLGFGEHHRHRYLKEIE